MRGFLTFACLWVTASLILLFFVGFHLIHIPDPIIVGVLLSGPILLWSAILLARR